MEGPADNAGGDTGMAGAVPARPHSGVYARWLEWRDGHPWLSRPLSWLGRLLPLPQSWRYAPTSWWGRVLDTAAPIFLMVFLIGVVINLIEPFGLGNASKAQSMRVSARAMAPFYDSPARDSIAVVLIDDTTLRRMDQGWPLAYGDYERLLRQVLAHQPRAVYLDVLLLERRHYDDTFDDAYEAMHESVRGSKRSARVGGGPVPVYFGVGAPGERSIFSRPGGVRDVVTSWQGAGDGYPLRLDCSHVNEVAVPGACGRGQPAATDASTVAFTLYQEACARGGAPGCSAPAADFPAAATTLPMVVQWGWRPDAPVADGPMPCEDAGVARLGRSPEPSPLARLGGALSLLWQSFGSGLDAGAEDRGRARCMHTPTVFAEHLADSSLLRQDDDTPALLEDRVVLIGTHLLGLDDRVQSPVNQQVPGVYMHAMALDNLMHWGEARVYVKPGLGYALGVLNAVLMSLVAAIFLLRRGGAPVRLVWFAAVAAALSFVGLVQVLLAQAVLRQPPQDWIGMALAAAAVMYVVSRDTRQSGTTEGGQHHGKDDAVDVAGADAGAAVGGRAGAGDAAAEG